MSAPVPPTPFGNGNGNGNVDVPGKARSTSLEGGFFDGKQIALLAGMYIVLPVAEDCGRMCSPHFSEWRYNRDGQFLSAHTRLGDMNKLNPDEAPHVPEWPTGPDRFSNDAPIGWVKL